MDNLVYLDNAATTKPFAELQDIFTQSQNDFYNPSALYDKGVRVHEKIEMCRQTLSRLIGGENGKIIFTASATEANNMALSLPNYRTNQSLVVSMGEHPSVFNKSKDLEQKGVVVKYVPLTQSGAIDQSKLIDYIDKNTALISIMHVSNETGVINDIKEIVRVAKRINPKVLVHCDGVQAFGKIDIDLIDLGVDLYTVSAHKIHGPKGIGFLWVKNNINIRPLIFGGGQESGYRSGTENVFAIQSFAFCAEKIIPNIKSNFAKIDAIKHNFISKLTKNGINYKVNGQNCSPYILNISIDGIRGEVLVHMLEKDNIYLSVGSACSSKKPDNRVLKQLGRTNSEIMGTVRISFSAYQDFEEEKVINKICEQIKVLTKKIAGEK